MSAQPVNPTTPPDHVNIEIDGKAMAAPKGSMIIHAADKAGIAIPRFCYHDKLPIAANCRMCLVDVEKAPKPMPACATPVMEGMKVYTQTKRALDSQRNVMEFLLINHPLDCPICDQGGECELQDVAMGYGRSVSRFTERKRVVADEDVGPLVATDMTRCIHCTRCVRFVSEIAGTYELGGMSRGENLQIGTYIGKSIESELSGNIIDVCPVGALTNKPFRFKARAWELIARESIGYHDALGSNLFLHTRRGEVLRTVPRDNEAVNETWLSDRDRYSHTGLRAEDRLSKPLLREGSNWREASWDEALAKAAELLKASSGDKLGVLVHPATSNEEGALLRRLADGLGCGNLDHRLGVSDFADAPVAQPFELALAEVETANTVLLLGCNPRLEAPLLGHRVRKAWKRGAQVHAINPVDFDFTFDLRSSRVVAPQHMVDALLGLARAAGEGNAETPPAGMAEALAAANVSDADRALAKSLRESTSAVLLVGEGVTSHPQASWLRALARYVANCTGARLNELPQGANAIGLARVGVLPHGLDAQAMLAQPRSAYLLYGIEPEVDFADNTAALKALGAAGNVVAFAAYASPALKASAHLLLPIGLLPEIEATLTNVDGREQTVAAGAKLPGDARPGWRVLRALGESLGVAGFEFTDVAGLRASIASHVVRAGDGLAKRPAAGTGLSRIATTAVYRSDAVVRRAAPLNAHPLNRPACVVLHPEDALAHGVSEGAIATLDDGRGHASLPVRISASVAKGGAWIESGHGATAPLAPNGARLSLTRA
jgi:NADH-quinone oxidoreductase subunit G